MKELKTVSSWFRNTVRGAEVWWRSGEAQQDLNLFLSAGSSQRALIAEFTKEHSEFDPTAFGEKSFLILKTTTSDIKYGISAEAFYCVMYKPDETVFIFGIDQVTSGKNIRLNKQPAKGIREIPVQAVCVGGSIVGIGSNNVHRIEKIEVYNLGLPVGIPQPVIRSTRRVVPNAA